MLTNRSTMTAEQLFAQPSDGYRYELIEGVLRMMSPAGGRHGRIANRIAFLLGKHVEAQQWGVVFAAETGFLISREPDTVLAPDVAFLQQSRYAALEDEVHYLPLAPDLAVEVLSPSDTFSRVEAKAMAWLEAGTRVVLVIDPELETVHAIRSPKRIEIFRGDETVDCSDAVPGWRFPPQDIFAQ
jgi:Uma2 family endonuclease